MGVRVTTAPGERWAAGELARLRAGAFSPRACAGFLRASFARAAADGAARPRLRRRARLVAVGGTAVALGAREGLAACGSPAPRRAAVLAWCAAEGAMLEWHLGMLDGRERLVAADGLTLGRAALVPFVAAAPPSRGLFTALLAAGGLSDALDGPLARRAGPSRLGRDCDTVADVLLVAAAARASRRAGWLGPGAARALAARYAITLGAAAWHYFARDARPPAGAFGETRWTAPGAYAGLGLAAAGRSRAAGALVGAAALGALASAVRPRVADRVGGPES